MLIEPLKFKLMYESLLIYLSMIQNELRNSAKIVEIRRSNPGILLGPRAIILGDPAGMQIGPGSQIEDGAVIDFRFGGSLSIGRAVQVRTGAMLVPFGGSIKVGDECGVNPYTILYGHGGLTVGNFVRFAAHCVIIPANHGISDTLVPITKQPLTAKGITIGNDVWFGAGCVVLDGVNIGDGCVIAAGAVVSKTISPMSIAAGVPASVVRHR